MSRTLYIESMKDDIEEVSKSWTPSEHSQLETLDPFAEAQYRLSLQLLGAAAQAAALANLHQVRAIYERDTKGGR